MNKYLRSLAYFIRSNWQVKRKILRILFIVIKISLIVKFLPLRHYYYYLVPHNEYGGDGHIVDYKEDIAFIKRVILRIPWRITCLMESLIIKRYLLLHDVNIPIMIGVKTNKELEAHAWYYSKLSNGYSQISI